MTKDLAAQDSVLGNFRPSLRDLSHFPGFTQDLRPGLFSAVPTGLVSIHTQAERL
jgi:hypothetical protein